MSGPEEKFGDLALQNGITHGHRCWNDPVPNAGAPCTGVLLSNPALQTNSALLLAYHFELRNVIQEQSELQATSCQENTGAVQSVDTDPVKSGSNCPCMRSLTVHTLISTTGDISQLPGINMPIYQILPVATAPVATLSFHIFTDPYTKPSDLENALTTALSKS